MWKNRCGEPMSVAMVTPLYLQDGMPAGYFDKTGSDVFEASYTNNYIQQRNPDKRTHER